MVIDKHLLFRSVFSIFRIKFVAMKNLFAQFFLVSSVFVGWLFLSSWSGGPVQECKNDSLAIIRVIKPVNELFKVKPAVFVSTGFGKIDEVKVSDADYGNGDRVLKQTLTDFLSNGYTIQTATETAQSGMQLNTYYLKKKII